jgi:ADP-dependent NAD(P)H-hydrate dehydratase / NAD(P)H-hydrate epimerase
MIKNRVVSSEDGGRIDRYTMEIEEKEGFTLMKKAGMSVADAVFELCQLWQINTCQIFCGKGNNGGDGIVAARELFLKGVFVDVFMTALPEDMPGDAGRHAELMLKSGIKPVIINNAESLKEKVKTKAVWVDALLGTGLRNTVRGLTGEILSLLTQLHRNQPVIAVDIPSGLDGTNGQALGSVLKADKTVTMGFYKAGLFLHEGKFLSGKTVLTDLNYSREAMNQAKLNAFLCNDDVVRDCIAPVRGTDHKYTRGQVVCMGGQNEMPGAIALACLSGLRAGAGMVRALVPYAVSPVIYQHALEIICHTGEKSYLSPADIRHWTALKEKTKAILIGPGMGRHGESASFIKQIISSLSVPAVLDADALAITPREIIRNAPVPLILTPHEGEFLHLVDISSHALASEPVQTLSQAARDLKQIIHLKSSTSMTGLPDGRVYIHPTGTPGMATAGCGDVLGGIIASLLAQGNSPESAALCGVHFHGLAAEKATAVKGCRGLIASDIIHALPEVMKHYEIIR